MPIRLGTGDLARYPFLNEAGEYLRQSGFGWLKVVHLNDSKGPLGSNLDRHEHIGLGNIGAPGLAAFVRHKAIAGLPIIMETPIEDKRGEAENMKAFLGLVSDLPAARLADRAT